MSNISKATKLRCIKCEAEFPLDGQVLTCLNHSPYYSYLEVEYDYESITEFPLTQKTGFCQFLPLLPINSLNVQLGEVSIPPFQVRTFGALIGHENLFVKDESRNPTGCFKDKSSLVLINKAIELGKKRILVISSGNGALSVSAYAQKAGIECTCSIPEKTSSAKVALIQLFGSQTDKRPGVYEDVYRAVMDEVQRDLGWNCTPGFNPFSTEGNKITAYEIWQTLGVPDKILVPCGNGDNLAGIWKGFCELKMLGKTDKLPKMIGVQIKEAAPIKVALEKNEYWVRLPNAVDSDAEGIVAIESYTSPKTVKAIKESGGCLIEVKSDKTQIRDDEIIPALKEIIRTESIVPEFTSASVLAAVKKIDLDPTEKVVCIITATGLKSLQEIIEKIRCYDLNDPIETPIKSRGRGKNGG